MRLKPPFTPFPQVLFQMELFTPTRAILKAALSSTFDVRMHRANNVIYYYFIHKRDKGVDPGPEFDEEYVHLNLLVGRARG